MDLDKLAIGLNEREGRRNRIYKDSLGIWSIGVGRNLQNNGLRDSEIDFMLKNDLEEALDLVNKAYPYFFKLDNTRQNAMIELMFNLGPIKLSGFKLMHHALGIGDYKEAARELKDSKWYTDVGPTRGNYIANALEFGDDLS